MATVIEVMAKLTGNASSMIAAFAAARESADETARSVRVSSEQASEALGKIAVPATVIAGGVGFAAKQFATMASEAEQNVGAVESVFKQYAETVKATSAQAATNVGISSAAYQQFASIVGSQLKNMGVPLSDVAGGTEDLIKKGADLASMFGGTTSEAIEAISSMLRGETDPIEKYGVSINQAAVEAKMLEMGLTGLTGPAEKNAQLQAKLAILNQQTADATGNFGREADTAAGAMQRANAKFEDAQSAIGTALLPLMTQLAQALAEASQWAAANSDAVLMWGAVLGGAALAILSVVAAMKVYEVAAALGTVATFLFQNALKGFGIGVLIVAVMAIAAVVKHLWDTSSEFRAFWTGAWEQIQASAGDALTIAQGAVDGFIPALQSMWEWMQDNTDVIIAIAAVIGTAMLPVLIRAGVAATISAAAQVTAWAASSAGAVKTGIIYVATSYAMVGAWIRQGVAATGTALLYAAAYAIIIADSIKAAAIQAGNVARVVAGWVLMGAQAMLQAARMAAAWFIALGPIGWVIGAIVGIVAIVIANWEAISSATAAIWSTVVNWVVQAWAGLTSWIAGAVAAVVNPIVDGFNGMVSFITGIFTSVGDFITGVWTWVFNLLTAIGAAFWAEHGAQLTAAWNFIVSIFTGVFNFYVSIWTAIINVVVTAAQNIWNAIVTAFNAVWNFIVTIFTGVFNFYVSIWTAIIGYITGAVTAIWGVISSVFSSVWGFISSIFNSIAAFISGVWNNIVAIVRGAAQGVWNTVSSTFNAVLGTISGIFNAAAGIVSGVWGGILGTIRGVVGQIGGVIGSIYGTVTGALANAGNWLVGAGRNIVQGLISGVQSLAGTIGNAFLSMVPGWIVGPFKAALGIASPSRLFRQFGRWIIQGLGSGVNQEKQTAVGAMEGAAAAVANAGSGITIDAPKIAIPEIPNIAASLTLPPLQQDIVLNFIGSPAEAIKRFAVNLQQGGPAAIEAAVTGGGYNAQALSGSNQYQTPPQAPQVNVNLVAYMESPITGEELEVKIRSVAQEETADGLSGTARATRNSRGNGMGGF